MERVKYSLEFMCKASPTIVYQFLTTPSCLMRWFCDEVDVTGTEFVFVWSGAAEVAELIDDEEPNLLRFKWEDADDEDEYLEFQIEKSPVSNETIITVTDFADEDEVDDDKALWKTQLTRMKEEMGG